jgi:alpha-1,3-rhamnosyl/mannosyltransferase
MRIALDARYVADHFPGIGRYVYNLAAALAALEPGPELCLLYNPALPNTRHDLTALARPGVVLVPATARPFSPDEQAAIPRLLRRLRADVYHAPYYVRPYAGLPCPSVTTLYDIIPRLFPGEVWPRARLLFDLLTRLAARVSTRLIALSASARADLAAAYRIPPERIAVTPLAADLRFRPQPPEAIVAVRARYGLPVGYVLCVSSNKPHKNLAGLVEAWHRLQITDCESQSGQYHLHAARCEPQLVIAGHWDARYPEARAAAARLGVAVRFLPGVPEADLPALYAGAEVFAYPSRYEGFGLPPLEAMACGAPVLCGGNSSLPEVVGDAALVVDVSDPQALATGLARLLGDAALRAELRERGLARAAGFSWRRAAEATLRVYAAAAGLPAP